jgi:nucleoside-diphosphate-sugar epimerase
MKTALVCGAGGFIGSHLVKRLKREGYFVRGVDLKYPEFSPTAADEFVIGDLRDPIVCANVLDRYFDRVYQLAADMGGAGFVFTGENDADIMHNSAMINLNMAAQAAKVGVGTFFYSSSACIYPERNQMDPNNPNCSEDSAYPAAPDSEYGWEKIFSERMFMAFARNKGLNIRIARFHNIFGPEGTWVGGREKAPAAMCRKVAEAQLGNTVEIWQNGLTTKSFPYIEMWGDGNQTRSFLYIDECLEGVERLMQSDYTEPLNIGSQEMVTINQLAQMALHISGYSGDIAIRHIPGPTGVRGRNSDNRLIRETLGWAPNAPLRDGMTKTYAWIKEQVESRAQNGGKEAGSAAPAAALPRVSPISWNK